MIIFFIKMSCILIHVLNDTCIFFKKTYINRHIYVFGTRQDQDTPVPCPVPKKAQDGVYVPCPVPNLSSSDQDRDGKFPENFFLKFFN